MAYITVWDGAVKTIHIQIVFLQRTRNRRYYGLLIFGEDAMVCHLPRQLSDFAACCCPACRTYEIATRFWVMVICPIIKCLTVLEFSFVLFDLCLFITIFNFILNCVLIVTFWIFTYHKIWILLIIYCFIWNYRIIYFWTWLEVFWSVVS